MSSGSLRAGTLNVWVITFFVVSAAGPLVAMAGGIPVAMLFGNGAGIPAMFLTAMVILCLFSVGYTAMAQHVRNAGAFYAFAQEGLGVAAGGASGVVALLSYNALQIGMYGLFGTAVDALLSPLTGIHLAWWIYALAALVSIAFFGYRQIDLSAKILGTLVAGEYLVVLLLDCGIIAQGGDNGLSLRPFQPGVFTSGSPWIGLMLCFSAFIGFEATTIYSEEAKDPARTIPRATYFSVFLIGTFYMVSTWAVVMGAGVDRLLPALKALPDPTQFLFLLSDRFMGPSTSAVMRVLFVTSVYACMLAFHNAIARYFFALGRDRVLPAKLARTHAEFQSPHIGSLLQTTIAGASVLLFAAAGADPVLTVFTVPSALATLGVILLMATTAIAVLCFFRRRASIGWPTYSSIIVSIVALSAVVIFAVLHFDVLTGTNALGARLLPLTLLAAGAIGARLAHKAGQGRLQAA